MNDSKTKICCVCKITKSKKQFYTRSKNGKYPNSVASSCKKCNIKRLKPESLAKKKEYMFNYHKQYYIDNKNKITEKNNKYYNENKEEISRTRKELYHNDPSYRMNRRCIKYKITTEEFNKFKEDQKNCCAICKKHNDDCYKGLFIDHCHETKKVRGLLCAECNLGIGYFKENLELLDKAKEYIVKTK